MSSAKSARKDGAPLLPFGAAKMLLAVWLANVTLNVPSPVTGLPDTDNNPVNLYLQKLDHMFAKFAELFRDGTANKALEDKVDEICMTLRSHYMVDRRERNRPLSVADLDYEEIIIYGLQDDLEDYRIEESHNLELEIQEALEDEYVEDE